MSMPWRVGSPGTKRESSVPSTGQCQANGLLGGGALGLGAGRGGGFELPALALPLPAVAEPPPGYSRRRWPGWMVYGGAMPFHAARSCRVMPLSVAIRYRFWPRWTVVVTPYFGVDTVTGPRWLPPPALRLTTWLLPHADSNSAATTPAPIRPSRLIRPVP